VVERLEISLNAQRRGSDYRIQLLPLPALEPDDGVEDVPVEPDAGVVLDPLESPEELGAVVLVEEPVTVTVVGELPVEPAPLVSVPVEPVPVPLVPVPLMPVPLMPVPVEPVPLVPVPLVSVPVEPEPLVPVPAVEPASEAVVVETLVDPGPVEDAPPLVTVPPPIELPPVAGAVELADGGGLVDVAPDVLPSRMLETAALPFNEVDPFWAAVPADG
jgi:hypothetical protein